MPRRYRRCITFVTVETGAPVTRQGSMAARLDRFMASGAPPRHGLTATPNTKSAKGPETVGRPTGRPTLGGLRSTPPKAHRNT